jgi:aldose 1-epimerase
MEPVLPTGQQIEIRHADARAVVVEQGGGLRSYHANGQPVLDGYAAEQMVRSARGQVLVPWPNRLHQGRYTWDGAELQVPVDEPDKNNALHGLCRFRSWQVVERSEHVVTMGVLLLPQPGYPFSLQVEARYELRESGLTVTTTATNRGREAAPYAQGSHPYLTVGTEYIDEARLTLPAATRLRTDADQIPTGREQVQGTRYDFRTPRRIGELEIDFAFTDLERDSDGRAVLSLQGPERLLELWVDEGYPYLEVFTGDTLPEHDRRRRALGVEPMTAPPNAFATGEQVVRLVPGETVSRTWGLRLLR